MFEYTTAFKGSFCNHVCYNNHKRPFRQQNFSLSYNKIIIAVSYYKTNILLEQVHW